MTGVGQTQPGQSREPHGDTVDGAAAPGRAWPASYALIRAMRYKADEVQLGRALYAVARQGGIAPALASAMIESVAPRFAARARSLPPVPPDVACLEQQQLFADVGRIRLRRRKRSVGWVDLDFANPSGSWRLAVELKIDSDFQPRQLPGYLASGRPVIAVVRNPDHDRFDVDVPGWIGAVAWSHLLPRLRALPVRPPELRAQWQIFLDVAEASGDFDVRKPSASTEAAANRALLAPLRGQVLERFQRLLDEAYGADGRQFARGVRVSQVGGDARMAWLRLDWPKELGAGQLVLELGDATSTVVWIRTWWLPDRRDLRRLRDAHRTITTKDNGFTETTGHRYRADDQAGGADNERRQAVLGTFQRRLSTLVRSGCLDIDVRGAG